MLLLIYGWPSWLQGHTAASCSTCPPGPPGPFLQRCFLGSWPQPVLVQSVIPPQVQDLAFIIVFHEVPASPFLQPFKIPLNRSPALQHIDRFPQFGIVCELTESVLHPIIQVVITICQLVIPLITTLLAQQSSQFSIHPIVHSSSPYLTNLAKRIPWETLSKASLQSRVFPPASGKALLHSIATNTKHSTMRAAMEKVKSIPARPNTGTLLAHVQPGVHQDPQVLFCQAAFQLGGPQHVLVPGVVPLQGQDFALPLVELHEVPVSPFLQLVEVPLDDSMTLWHISYSSHFCVTSKLAEGTLCPIIQIINEEVKHYWPQYRPLGYTSSDLPPTALCATDHHPLGPAIQPIFNPPHCLLIQPIRLL
ncbi:hypothetical protein QYF61_005582 [Mycteria americana]|uniref:Uncharacterized protein n=1 Tax=Mycteria americana TaxID=33587 RepID=A0AAN7MLT9_MYCAM|nr:hypothetical protein QYF61_005582 [Mycteria americana]